MIHYTAMPTGDAACRTLCDPKTEVSAHYLIDADGTVRSLVAEDQRAWHAGAGRWGDVTDVNSRSIGIELANDGGSPFAAPQIAALVGVLRGICDRWQIPASRIIGHADMAPGRKIDPGPRFDWRRLAREGVGIWWNSAGANMPAVNHDHFRDCATRFGYPDIDDALLLLTMRMRFRPWAHGQLDGVDMAIMTDLAARFPVDAGPVTA